LNLSDGDTAEIPEQFVESDSSGKTFGDIKWFNKQADYKVETAYHEVANPVWNWIGNEIEIDWWYSFKALLVEIPS
jgi:hypothetical protein